MTRKPNHTFDSSNTRHTMARLLAALETPQGTEQLRTTLHMSERSLRLYLAHLRSAPRRVRVAGYVPAKFGYSMLFALGSEADAPRPKPLTETQRNAKRNKKVKADPELRLKRQLVEKARWAMTKAVRAPQNPFSALGL